MTRRDDWNELKPKLDRICLRRGVGKVAEQIPVNRVTLYRLLNNKTVSPSQAVYAGIERVVADQQDNYPEP